MANTLKIVRTIAELRGAIALWRQEGLSVGLVPTMGALHEGHFSLVEQSCAQTDRTITTLFVNPKQFGEGEDLDVYPRNEAVDAEALAARGVHLLFAPGLDEMYRAGAVTAVAVPGLGDLLEGEFRPGFFTGVATVVAKLLIQSLPDKAFFGEKDFQQLCVIKRLTEDLDIPVEIIGCPIIREHDGLALSSRNAYLSPDERQNAPALFQALGDVAASISKDVPIAAAIDMARTTLLNQGFTKVDYIAVRDPVNLETLESVSKDARILAAAWLGKTRLIDNLPIKM